MTEKECDEPSERSPSAAFQPFNASREKIKGSRGWVQISTACTRIIRKFKEKHGTGRCRFAPTCPVFRLYQGLPRIDKLKSTPPIVSWTVYGCSGEGEIRTQVTHSVFSLSDGSKTVVGCHCDCRNLPRFAASYFD